MQFNNFKVYRLITCVALLLLATSGQAQTPETTKTGLERRGEIAAQLLSMHARAHTDIAQSFVGERFEWSPGDEFIVGTSQQSKGFVYNLPTNNGYGTGTVAWSRLIAHTSRARMEADAASGLQRSDGSDYAAVGGLEWHDTKAMFGAAVSYQRGKQNFSSVHELDGHQSVSAGDVHFYGIFGGDNKPNYWMMTSFGQGDLQYSSGKVVRGANTNTTNLIYGGGIKMPIKTRIRNNVSVNGSITQTRFKSKRALITTAQADATNALVVLPELNANYLQARITIDANLYFDGNHSAFWWARIQAGLRYEDNATYSQGVGADFMTSLAFQALHHGVTAKLFLQATQTSTSANYSAISGGVEFSYDSKNDGRGFVLTLRPEIGSQPLQFDPLAAPTTHNQSFYQAGASIHLVVSWRP